MTGTRLQLPPFVKSLSARLLILTIFFVMLSEVLIYAPSIGRFRVTYLQERLASAHLAVLALEATPDQMVSEDLADELMSHAGVYSVALMRPEDGNLMLMTDKPEVINATYDLRQGTFFGLIGDAAVTLLHPENRVIRVLGPSPKDSAVRVDIVLDEAPMRAAMLDYSGRILALSLFISIATAALVYLSLHLLLVRPMRGITANMTAFRDDPEDASRVIRPSDRRDEVGVAERELANMQEGLRAALQQKTRLAAVGTAVTKIAHDLRNILATAHLVSDSLARSDDPLVRQATPTLIRALDRALDLCRQTLRFTTEGPVKLELTRFDVTQLLQDVGSALPEVVEGQAEWVIVPAADESLEVEADHEQLFRVLANLGGNALQAGATRIEVTANRFDDHVMIDVADNGPGLPEKAKTNLFKAFAGSTRQEGSGLGLAIVRELMRAHGGDVTLKRSCPEGCTFSLVLPVSQARPQRRPRSQHPAAAE